jgi:hypothetical protein
MRVIFGILSFCAAGLLAFWLVPVVDQIVLGYLLRDQSVGFSLMQFGPVHLYEGHICICAAVIALLMLALIVAGIYLTATGLLCGTNREQRQSLQ